MCVTFTALPVALLAVVYLAIWIWRKRLPESAWFYRAPVVAGPLAVVALISGWVVTEVGRQPVGRLQRDAHRRGGHRRARDRGRLRRAGRQLCGGRMWAGLGATAPGTRAT